MSGSHSSIDIDTAAMGTMPQHLIGNHRVRLSDPGEKTTTMSPSSRDVLVPRGGFSRGGFLSIASSTTCCLILAISFPAGHNALSLSTTSSKSSSLVNQARMIRELKQHNHGHVVSGGVVSSSASHQYDTLSQGQLFIGDQPLMNSAALSASLFDDFANSLESAVAKNNHPSSLESSTTSFSEKSLAEEYDRFMAEDVALASMIHEHTKPGSLVDTIKQTKGADVIVEEDTSMEVRLQREAAYRRRIREQQQEKQAQSIGDEIDTIHASSSSSSPSSISRPSIKVMRRSKLAAAAVPAKQRRHFTKSTSAVKTMNPSSSSPLLTREQEYALAHTIQAGTHVHKLKAEYESTHSEPLTKKAWAQLANMSSNELRKLISDYRTAKQELVSSNMGLVRAVVSSQYARKAYYSGVPIDELIQEGSLGLIRAAELFDPAKGLRFSTYATIWIKGVLSNTNSLDEVINLPNREKAIWNKIKQAMEDMANEASDSKSSSMASSSSSSGTKPSSEEILASKLNMDIAMVQQHLRRMNSVSKVLSLDYQYSSTTRSGFSENNKQEALQSSLQFGVDADLAERAQFKADILSGLVRNLTEREVTLMRLRYGLEDGTEYTVKECAAMMGINRETIRKLQHSCLKKLREASNMESLQEYLLTVA
jgi:RNA polymerase sigma factor (sigma-70 family)